ncbi:DMT family transporter [Saccharicrinis sp. FJH2]|uniref:DMT family transporter n=1 Tax=Saccharicrinis sp. FJH65 TaxID=3344659 RepID=UPI0035F34A2D
MKRETNTIVLAIIACLLWSSAFAVIKVGLQYTQPLQFAGIRFTLSGLMLVPLAMRNKGYWNIIFKNLPFILLVSFLHVFGLYAFFYNGMSRVPGAIGAIIVGSGPLFIAFMSHFMMDNDKMGLKKALVMLLGFSGIVLVSLGKKATGSADFQLIGVLFLLVSNTLGGFANIVIAKSKGKVPALVLSSTTLVIGGIGLFVLSLPIEGLQTGPFPLEYWLSLSWLSMLSAVAISIWFSLLRRPGIKVSSLNMWKFLVPVSGVILSWIIISSEKPDVITLSGMLLTAVALVLISRVDRKRTKLVGKTKS